LMMA